MNYYAKEFVTMQKSLEYLEIFMNFLAFKSESLLYVVFGKIQFCAFFIYLSVPEWNVTDVKMLRLLSLLYPIAIIQDLLLATTFGCHWANSDRWDGIGCDDESCFHNSTTLHINDRQFLFRYFFCSLAAYMQANVLDAECVFLKQS